jgi:hypothetical protein
MVVMALPANHGADMGRHYLPQISSTAAPTTGGAGGGLRVQFPGARKAWSGGKLVGKEILSKCQRFLNN